MKRTIEIEVSLNGIDLDKNPEFCQGDKNTHFIQIHFLEEVELTGYTLQVHYLPPRPSTVPYVDQFKNLTPQMVIPIPDVALERNGDVTVEFSLSKENELITINQNFAFKVKRTINGTSLTAYPVGTFKQTIAQQIEEIKALLGQTDTKIIEYNQNATDKTTTFNLNATSKTDTYNTNHSLKIKEYNDNAVLKTDAFNNNSTKKTTDFDSHVRSVVDTAYINLDKKATDSATLAGNLANQNVKNQEGLSLAAVSNEGTKQVGLVRNEGNSEIQKVQNTGITEIGKVTTEGTKQVNAIITQETVSKKAVEDTGLKVKDTAISEINTTKTNTIANIKRETDTYVLQTSKPSINTHVETISKPNIDNYVETVSKKNINDYITLKEAEIKGATFTPAVSPNGDLSFTNDKNLPNPPLKNIMGPVGPVGPKPVKGVDYLTEAEKQQFTTETVGLVTAEGTKQTQAITNKGVEQIALVTSEGTKQTSLVNTEGTKVIEQVKNIVAGNPATTNALTLSGKTRAEFEKEIQGVAGGYSGNFPLTAATLNGIYLVPQTGKFYVCTQAYNGTQISAPNSNFEELSVFKNRDRLSNLCKPKKIFEDTNIRLYEDINNYYLDFIPGAEIIYGRHPFPANLQISVSAYFQFLYAMDSSDGGWTPGTAWFNKTDIFFPTLSKKSFGLDQIIIIRKRII